MKFALRRFLILAGASLALLVGNIWLVPPDAGLKALPMALANAAPFHMSWDRLFPATGW